MDNEQFANMWKIFHQKLDLAVDNMVRLDSFEYSSVFNFIHITNIVKSWINEKSFLSSDTNAHVGTVVAIISCIKRLIRIHAYVNELYKETEECAIKEFDIVTAYKQLKDCSYKILIEKAKEYSANNNRFHNFNKAANLFGYSPQYFCVMFMIKHVISLSDTIDRIIIPSREVYLSKITDIYNYLLILMGMLLDMCRIKEEEYETFFESHL